MRDIWMSFYLHLQRFSAWRFCKVVKDSGMLPLRLLFPASDLKLLEYILESIISELREVKTYERQNIPDWLDYSYHQTKFLQSCY